MQQQWQMHRYTAFMIQQMNWGGKKVNPIKRATDLFEMDVDKVPKGDKKKLKFVTVERVGKD